MLQLSNIELAEYCEQELERNPILEHDDSAPGPAEEAAPRAEVEDCRRSAERGLSRDDFSKTTPTWTRRRTLYV